MVIYRSSLSLCLHSLPHETETDTQHTLTTRRMMIIQEFCLCLHSLPHGTETRPAHSRHSQHAYDGYTGVLSLCTHNTPYDDIQQFSLSLSVCIHSHTKLRPDRQTLTARRMMIYRSSVSVCIHSHTELRLDRQRAGLYILGLAG